jgi:hypothetical protein
MRDEARKALLALLPLVFLPVSAAEVLADSSAGARRSALGDEMVRANKPLNAPSARIWHALTSVGNDLYLFGGKRAASGGGAECLSDLWRFENDAWTRLQPLVTPAARHGHVLIARQRAGEKGKLLMMGGSSDVPIDRGCCEPTLKYLTDIWAYDIALNAWQKMGDQPDAMNWGFSCSDGPEPACSQHGPPIAKLNVVGAGDDLIMAVGGHRPPGPRSEWIDSNEIWYLDSSSANLSSWRWREYELSPSNEQTLPPRYFHGTVWVKPLAASRDQAHGVLVVFGGSDDSRLYFDDTWILSLRDRMWHQIPPSSEAIPPARAHHSMAVHGRDVYMHGGIDGIRTYNDLWRFDVESRTWSQINLPASTLINRCNFAMTAVSSGLIYLHGGALDSAETDAKKYLDDSLWRIDATLLCDVPSFFLRSSGGGRCKSCQQVLPPVPPFITSSLPDFFRWRSLRT